MTELKACLTDAEVKTFLMKAAMRYAEACRDFAQAISQEAYRKRDGSIPTKEEVEQAFNDARQAEKIGHTLDFHSITWNTRREQDR